MNNTKEVIQLENLYEGIFNNIPKIVINRFKNIKSLENYNGKVRAIRTPNGWQVFMDDPRTNELKPIADVLGTMMFNEQEDDKEDTRKRMHNVSRIKHGEIDPKILDKIGDKQ